MSADMIFVLLVAGTFASVWLAGRLAAYRGRGFRTWAWIGVIIGPLALLLLLPKLRDRNGDTGTP